jgi:hypothetical protein
MFQVGCDGHLWKQHMQLVQRLKQQARDGTLSEVLQQPVVGWHVKTEASSAHRERREVPVSKQIILGEGDYNISPANASLKISWVKHDVSPFSEKWV